MPISNCSVSNRAVLLAGLCLALAGAWFAVNQLHFRLNFTHWAQAFWVLVGAPLVEEWLFRATLQPLLQKRLAAQKPNLPKFATHVMAIAVVSLLFALCHWPLLGVQSLWVIAPSLLLGACWALTQRLWLCAVLHAAFNGGLAIFTAQVSALAS
jgi:membrane protease YdiL (CAAX protease family)